MTTTQPNKEKVVIHRQMTIEQILSLFPYKAQKLAQEITSRPALRRLPCRHLGDIGSRHVWTWHE